MRSALLTASALIVTAVFACAQGTDPNAIGDLGGDGTDTDGGGTGLPPNNNFDGGTNPYQTPADGGNPHQKEAGTAGEGGTTSNEGGTTTGTDAGTTAKDSGTTMAANGDCVGTTSSNVDQDGNPLTYDDECDNYYFYNVTHIPFTSNPNNCVPGANDCAALNGGGLTFCCYKQQPGDFCADDYKKPQCVPQ